jgi:hypothetical protein
MLEPSAADAGVDAWLESLEASLAPTSASLGNEPESLASTAGSGFSTSESFAKCNPDGSLSKTSQQSSLFQQEESYSEGLPKAGMMRSGYLFELPTWEHRISESASSSSPGGVTWKTPHGMGGLDATGKHGGAGGGEFAKQANGWMSPSAGDSKGRNYTYDGHQRDKPRLALGGEAENWPTPDAGLLNDGESPESFEQRRQRNLEKHQNGMGTPLGMAVKNWPTPHGEDAESCGNHPNSVSDSSGGMAKLWTTPQSHDAGAGKADRVRRFGTQHGGANLADDVTAWNLGDGSEDEW